ncbi:hypothetical protein JCM15831A_08170 [Asaia astilbis]
MGTGRNFGHDTTESRMAGLGMHGLGKHLALRAQDRASCLIAAGFNRQNGGC